MKLKVGELYKWEPLNWEYASSQTYTIFLGNRENIFSDGHHLLDKGGIVCVLEIALGDKFSVDYRVLTLDGIIGWVRISHSFLGDWVQISL